MVRLIVNLSEHESAHFTESASLFSCVLLTCGMMSGITRRIRTVPTNVVLARSSKSLPRRTPTSERLFFRRFFPSLFVYGSGAGRDELVDFPHLFSSWRKLQASSFVHFPFVFPLIAFSLLPFHSDRFPFAFRRCSFLDSFISGLNFLGSDLLIQTFLHHGLRFLVGRF